MPIWLAPSKRHTYIARKKLPGTIGNDGKRGSQNVVRFLMTQTGLAWSKQFIANALSTQGRSRHVGLSVALRDPLHAAAAAAFKG